MDKFFFDHFHSQCNAHEHATINIGHGISKKQTYISAVKLHSQLRQTSKSREAHCASTNKLNQK